MHVQRMTHLDHLRAAMHAKAAELGIGHRDVLAVSERLDVEILREMRCEDGKITIHQR